MSHNLPVSPHAYRRPLAAGLGRKHLGEPRLHGRPVLLVHLARQVRVREAEPLEQLGVELRLDRAAAARTRPPMRARVSLSKGHPDAYEKRRTRP